MSEKVQLTKCSNCGAVRRTHYACSECGFYRGRQVLGLGKAAEKASSVKTIEA